MHLYLVTPCGRYGKCHGESFLRRRSTLEPMDTPRRYYKTGDKYQEGRISSAAAWEEWKRERFGDVEITRSPWFELVDQELRGINSLVQSSVDEDFRRGLRKLQDRVSASEQAESNLTHVGKSALKEERTYWEELVRRGPPLLEAISKCLESDPQREEGKEKLFKLCYNEIVSRTIEGPPVLYHPHASISTTRQENEFETVDEQTSTTRAISHLNQIYPPTGAPRELPHISRTANRPNSTTERPQASSRTHYTQSFSSARTTIRQTISRPSTSRPTTSRPTTNRPAEPSRPTTRPPIPSGPPPIYATLAAGANANLRPRLQRLVPIAAPAGPSPQTAIYMEAGGTKPPTYISPSQFFAWHGEEHGVERPPAYATEAPAEPPAAHFIPRDRLDEDLYEMQMEGRHHIRRVRHTAAPSSIPRTQNDVDGGEGERESDSDRGNERSARF